MKMRTLLATAAVASLMAAPALAGDPIYQGSWNSGGGNNAGSLNYSGGFIGGIVNAANLVVIGALDLAGVEDNSNQNISMIVISGGAQDNNGTAATSDGATFTLQGNVTPDCAYYSGNVDTDIDFGEIGIYASDNTGPANAFDMVAPASVLIETNLAGCNTSNTVTLSKNDIRGMVNNSGVGYDGNVFQANLEYSAVATYTAGAVGSTAGASSGSWVNLAASGANSASATHGAWKSPMDIAVNIPVPSKSLLAGNYEGELTVTIAVL